jgi:hypothetical protein
MGMTRRCARAAGVLLATAALGCGSTGDDCVATSQGLSADITFAGGKLGIYNNDFKPEDNVPGTGGNPT